MILTNISKRGYKVPQFVLLPSSLLIERKINDLLIYLLPSPASTQYRFFQIQLGSENWCQMSLTLIIWDPPCQIRISSLCQKRADTYTTIEAVIWHFNCIYHSCTSWKNHTVLGSTALCTCAFSLNKLLPRHEIKYTTSQIASWYYQRASHDHFIDPKHCVLWEFLCTIYVIIHQGKRNAFLNILSNYESILQNFISEEDSTQTAWVWNGSFSYIIIHSPTNPSCVKQQSLCHFWHETQFQ